MAKEKTLIQLDVVQAFDYQTDEKGSRLVFQVTPSKNLAVNLGKEKAAVRKVFRSVVSAVKSLRTEIAGKTATGDKVPPVVKVDTPTHTLRFSSAGTAFALLLLVSDLYLSLNKKEQ